MSFRLVHVSMRYLCQKERDQAFLYFTATAALLFFTFSAKVSIERQHTGHSLGMKVSHGLMVQVIKEGAGEELAIVVQIVGKLHLGHQGRILDPTVAEDDFIGRGGCGGGDGICRADRGE